MGLPQIIIELKRKASTLIQRSSRGIVVLLLKDDTNIGFTRQVYKSKYDDGIAEKNWTAENIDYIEKAFEGKPSTVICERIGATAEESTYTLEAALDRLTSTRFNYLAMPQAEAGDATTIADWVDAMRNGKKKSFKAVLANSASDDYGIINFTTTNITVGEKVYTTAEYTARLAGIFAGLSLDRSATYYVLDEVISIAEHENPDEAIDKGELILINDGEKIKIGRAVNSKVKIEEGDIADMKKIKIIEGMDMLKDDIMSTFADNYVGKVSNSYDNKVAFCAAVNAYFKDITKEGVLYDQYDNSVSVDISAQEKYLKEQGIDTSTYTEEQLKNANTGAKVFVSGGVQFQDAMEDLQLSLTM